MANVDTKVVKAPEVKMEYRRLGKAGIKVSALSFGNWVTMGYKGQNFQKAYDCAVAAYKGGVNFFDTAEAYASGEAEKCLGEIIKKAKWKRSDLVVSTKIFWGGKGPNDRGLCRKHIIEGLNASLKRLQLDYVDLVFCHRPDPDTPIEETVRAMNYVINKGLAFYWGTSEWSTKELLEAHRVATRLNLIPPTMEQPQYNMMHRKRFEAEYAPLYSAPYSMGTTIWSPLCFGMLTGKYNDGKFPPGSRFASDGNYSWKTKLQGKGKEELLKKLRALKAVADKLKCTMAQLALGWCLTNPNVSSVILGASKPAQVEENLKSLAVSKKITPQIKEELEAILGNKP